MIGIITAIAYEAAKRDTIHAAVRFGRYSEQAILRFGDKLDTWFPVENPACDGTLMCLREGGRGHKRDCPGKTVAISSYVRGLK